MAETALRGAAQYAANEVLEPAWPPWSAATGSSGPLSINAHEQRYFDPAVWIGLSTVMGCFIGFLLASRAWALTAPERKGDGKKPQGYAILQVTIRHHLRAIDIVALIWCFLPFVVPSLFAMWWICARSFFPLYALAISMFCVILNEGILKSIFKQPRPVESAANSWGFPSGHVLNAFCLMVWLFLEVAIPADHRVPIHWRTVAAITVVFAPVPWARYHNGDHSLQQVTWSMFLGGALAVAAFVTRRLFFPFFEHPWE